MRNMPVAITTYLKTLRERRGLSMDELAERIETTGSTISKLEKGQMKLTVEWMEKLAEALGVHPAELIDDRPSAGQEPQVTDVEMYVGRGACDPLLVLRRDGYELYRVLTDAMSGIGIRPDTILLVDH